MNELARQGGYFVDVITSKDGNCKTYIVGWGFTESRSPEEYQACYENEFFRMYQKMEDGSYNQIMITELSTELRADPPMYTPLEFMDLVTNNFIDSLGIDKSFVYYKEKE